VKRGTVIAIVKSGTVVAMRKHGTIIVGTQSGTVVVGAVVVPGGPNSVGIKFRNVRHV
jgi:hypothetical protein